MNAFFGVVYCWQYVKTREGLLELCSFHCIGSSSVPPPMRCWTLGRAMHRKACRLALVEACMLFFCVVSCWQCVENHEGLVKLCGFHSTRGGSVPPPMSCRTLGGAMDLKVCRLGLVEACMLFSALYLVGNV